MGNCVYWEGCEWGCWTRVIRGHQVVEELRASAGSEGERRVGIKGLWGMGWVSGSEGWEREGKEKSTGLFGMSYKMCVFMCMHACMCVCVII